MKKVLAIAAVTLALTACSSASSTTDGVKWTWTQTGTGSDGAPTQEIHLVNAQGATILTKSCTGTVSVLSPGANPTIVRCWWAGGGNDYALIIRGGKPVPQTRTVDEEAGEGEWQDIQ
jgi:hypothetical protein